MTTDLHQSVLGLLMVRMLAFVTRQQRTARCRQLLPRPQLAPSAVMAPWFTRPRISMYCGDSLIDPSASVPGAPVRHLSTARAHRAAPLAAGAALADTDQHEWPPLEDRFGGAPGL
jgi:hypothetical protein